MMRAPVTVLVLTYNEEVNVEHCLASVSEWAGEIVVVDSFSSDRTLQICAKFTDRIVQHAFENHGKQVNWALQHLHFQHPWILQLDADEMVTPQLACEISGTLPRVAADVAGFYIKRRVYFLGRWIRHGDYYPIWLLRLFRHGAARNEEFEEDRVVLLSGRPGRLRHDFIDHNRKGLGFWTDKHNGWAANEARDTLALLEGGGDSVSTLRLSPSLLSRRQDLRRRWLKTRVYIRTPPFLRAFLFFLYRYVFRLGFLDGKEGLIFHFLHGCWYRFYVDARIHEMRQARPGTKGGG